MRVRSVTPLIGAVLAAAVLAPTLPAHAQSEPSPAEIRRENARLTERIKELEAALAESERRIEAIRKEMQALRDELAAAAQPAPGATSPVPGRPGDAPARAIVADPADRFFSPDCMLAWLTRDYHESLDGLPRSTDAEREAYIAAVENWVKRASLEREPVEWPVRCTARAALTGRHTDATFERIDPQTLEPVSTPFVLSLSGREARRVADAPEGSLWTVHGVFGAEPQFDTERAQDRLAESPETIGPWAKFGWSFALNRLAALPPAPPPR